MSVNRIHSNAFDRHTTSSNGGPTISIAGTALAIVLLAAYLHPDPLVLPLLSVVLVAAGCIFAGIVALHHRCIPTTTRKSPLQERLLGPGLVIFTGFAAAILGDPDLALQSFDSRR